MMMELLPTGIRIYIYCVTALLGLVMGSALNCLAFRIARSERWSGGRSVCPSCGHVLAPRDLVPVLSWLFLRGRCRYCGERIPARYPLTELTLALCYLLLLRKFGLTLHTLSCAVLVSCLFCLSLVDVETMTIPNRFLLVPACVRSAELLLSGGPGALTRALLPALALGGGILLLSVFMDRILKKESIGGGDIKLLAMLGMFFSAPECLFLLLAACLAGLIAAVLCLRAGKGEAFPFGPAISVGAFLTLTVGDSAAAWYLGLFM